MSLSPLKNNRIYGHDEAKRFFLDSFKSNRLHHSWLIGGEKGIGKATLSYHFAKFLLQHPLYRPSDLEITNINNVIKKIEGLSHPDLIVIDADTKDGELRKQPNITIEEIREVTKFLRLTPSESNYRVVIIDGADNMNISASNALLKILEEPPKNSVIFLITSSMFKILPTIRSRCINLKLQPLKFEEFSAAVKINIPSINAEEIKELHQFSEGNLKLAIEVYKECGIKALKELERSLESRSIGEILKFAEGIKSSNENWPLIRYVILRFTINKIKHNLNNNFVDSEAELDYFSALQKKLIEAETFNLDKQHFILSILS